MDNFINGESIYDFSGKESIVDSKVQKATTANEVLVKHIKMHVSYVASKKTKLYEDKYTPQTKSCLSIVKKPSKALCYLKRRLIDQLVYTNKVDSKPIIISLEPHRPKLA